MSVKLIKLILLCLVFPAFQLANISAQTPTGAAFTQPAPNKDLLTVEHPDITDLEEDVRRQITDAQKSLLTAANDNKTDAKTLGDAFGILGQIYHLYTFYPAADACYENARRLEPEEFRWIYLLGKSAQQQDKFTEALGFFNEAARLDPKYTALPVNLGDIYLELNRLNEAVAEYQKALELDPKTAAAVFGLGQIELARRNFVIAAVYFERVLQMVPAANRVYYSLGTAYRGQKEMEKASAALARQGTVGVRAADPLFDALQELRQGVRLHLLRGKQALEAGRFNEAAAEYRRVIAAEPENITARVNLGAVLIQLGESQEAAEQFAEAVRIDPKNTNARFNLGILLSLQKKPLEAIIQFQKILRDEPNDFETRFQLAKQFLAMGRDDEALEEFAGIVRDKPDMEKALIELVNLLLKKKRYPEVLEALEKSHAEFPRNTRTTALLARFLAASPRYSLRDGQRALELAQELYQQNATVEHGELVALAYAELIKCAEAARWQQAMIDQLLKAGDKAGAQKLVPALKRYRTALPCRAN